MALVLTLRKEEMEEKEVRSVGGDRMEMASFSAVERGGAMLCLYNLISRLVSSIVLYSIFRSVQSAGLHVQSRPSM